MWSTFIEGVKSLPADFRALPKEIRALPELVRTSAKELRRVRSLSGAAMLSAIGVLINQFTIPLGPFLKLGFYFLPVAVSGMLFGPVLTGLIGVATDLLKFFTTPGGEPFFPGYTLGEFLRGFLFGLVLYQKRVTVKRIAFAKILDTIINNLVLNPLWLSILYGNSFWGLLTVRLTKNLLLLPLEILLLYLLCKKTAQVYSAVTKQAGS